MGLLLDVARDWSLLSLVALALVLVYKATGVFNLAQGTMMLLDAYLIYALSSATGSPLLGLLLTLAVQVPLGIAIYLMMRRLISRQALWAATITTIGIGLMLEAVISYAWKFNAFALPSPLPDSLVHVGGSTSVSVVDLAGIGVALAVCAAVVLGQRYTRAGLTLRAAGESPLLSSQSGVDVRRLFAAVWCIGLACAALGAALYGYRSGTNPSMTAIGLGAIAPAMLGGLDSLGGVFVGAAVAALAQQLALRYLGGDTSEFTLFALVLLVLLVEPTGFFGTAQAERA